MVANGWGREEGGVTARGDGISFEGGENILELDTGDGCTSL